MAWANHFTSSIWLQKCVIMCWYKKILFGIQWAEVAMKIVWGILAATYIVVQIVVFTDCRPLRLYWQVLPDAGVCQPLYCKCYHF
jgi:hypothetical protein